MLSKFFEDYAHENESSFADRLVLAIHAEMLRLGYLPIESKDGKDKDAFKIDDFTIATKTENKCPYLKMLPTQWKDRCMYKILYVSPQLDAHHPSNKKKLPECGTSLKAVLFDNDLKIHVIDSDGQFEMINLDLNMDEYKTEKEKKDLLTFVKEGIIEELSHKWPLQRTTKTQDNTVAHSQTTESDDGAKVITRSVQSVYSHHTHARPTNLIGRDNPMFGITGPVNVPGIRSDWVSPVGNIEPDNDIQRPPDIGSFGDIDRGTQNPMFGRMPSAADLARSISREGNSGTVYISPRGTFNATELRTMGSLGPGGIRTSPSLGPLNSSPSLGPIGFGRMGSGVEGQLGGGLPGNINLPGLNRGNSGPFGGPF